MELTARLHPEVVLMDLLVAELDGVTAVSWIKTWHPHTVVLVLTIMGRTTEVLRALENGADGYLLKDAPREELFEAIRGAASRS